MFYQQKVAKKSKLINFKVKQNMGNSRLRPGEFRSEVQYSTDFRQHLE